LIADTLAFNIRSAGSSPDAMTKREIILNISSEASLLQTRTAILEQAGFSVISASDYRQVVAACESQALNLAIIGHSLDVNERKRVASTIRDKCPNVPVVALYKLGKGEVDGIGDYALPADDPAMLLTMITRIIREGDPGNTTGVFAKGG
jgi:DNA-binding response OmpR family regulator